MTTKHAAYVVVLEESILEDTAGDILTTLGMIKGVVDVRPIAEDLSTIIAEARVKSALRGRLYQLHLSLFEES